MQIFSLCHLEIVGRELGYGVGRECSISVHLHEGPREVKSKRKKLLLLINLVGRDQRIKGFVPGKSGFTYLLYDID